MSVGKFAVLCLVIALVGVVMLLYVLPAHAGFSMRSGTGGLQVSSWIYILQDADIEEIIKYSPNLVVMDYSRDGTEDTVYSFDDIRRLRERGIIPIAYLSIGEAEDYRWYWKDSFYDNPPIWLGMENPNWPGNYAVKFWYPQWQNIILQYVDKIIDQGFLGVYLDKVDIYEYWADESVSEHVDMSEDQTASLMIAFVNKISRYAKRKNSSFYIFVQNAESIIRYDCDNIYIGSIDGIGVESLFYDERGIPHDKDDILHRLKFLRTFKQSGKIILDVEYIYSHHRGREDKLYINALRRALYHGIIPYISSDDLALDKIIVIPPLQPPWFTVGGMCYLMYR